jgi:hypothetical protein
LSVKLRHGRDDFEAQRARLAGEFAVDAVFDATEPLWYTRLTAPFRLTWRREAATVATAFLLGIAIGWVARRP